MKKTGRILLVLLVIVVGAMLLLPTIKWYCFTPDSLKELAAGTNLQIREYSRGQASRDVRELKALFSSSPESQIPEKYEALIPSAKAALKKNGKASPKSWTVKALLSAFDSEAACFEASESIYRDEIMAVKKLSSRVLQLGLDLRGGMSVLLEADIDSYVEKTGSEPTKEELTKLLSDDIDILTSRIDQFGVSEPDIRLQGTDQILIEVPGEADPERVNSFLRGSGSLTFQLVDSALTKEVNASYKRNPSSIFSDDGHMITPSYIPEGKTLAGYYTEDEYGIEVLDSLVVINDEIGLDGIHLESAEVSKDNQSLRPVINFHLDSEGGKLFYALTKANVGNQLAVVMDGKVKSVATINSAIQDSVQLSGGFTEEEANSLAIVLKTAALPIDLKVLSQQSVGATLGDDAVSIALKAICAGIILVVLFMAVYYGPAGFIADFALLMNFYMMIAVLSAMNFTLTLASIAGLVLTLGMAIDANVIIYERMKEELKAGETIYDAVKEGFGKAFWTITDSNVTTIIAAVVLSIFGSSSVKGFANTLAIGVACSLFTALFVSHLFFDLIVREDKGSIKLSWRKTHER